MVATPPIGAPDLTEKPPDTTSGVRRHLEVSSSPNTKSEKEAVQPKKKVSALNLDQPEGFVEDITAKEMEAEASPPIEMKRCSQVGDPSVARWHKETFQ
ncbi:unnamed protein product [Linum trigynum]|uniref:Uncharacterized protein n=1 Tax=Linum trigynum TaxID=586398 RepID=A0AAV2FEI8_9ROSI